MVLKIFRAANSFLYLPTYIAEDFGIFSTLLEIYGVNKVEFVTSHGDVKAIKSMLDENKKKSSISIAIADPVSFLSPRHKNIDKNEVKVIGAIIDKLPFWAVNHTDTKFKDIKDFSDEFEEVIHCNSSYSTGFYLGSYVKNTAGISNGIDVDFGKEVETLQKYNNEASRDAIKAVAITADIVSIAQGLSNSELKINYSFTNQEHLTTGIITSNICCELHSEILIKIIEAIQKSIAILYCSRKVAVNICKELSVKKDFNTAPLNDKDVVKIFDLIEKGKFYPGDLNITKESWIEGVKGLSIAEGWQDNDFKKDMIDNSFSKYVDNAFVLKSEKSIADQFGIDLNTFEDGLTKYTNEISSLKVEISTLKEQAKYYIKWLHSISILLKKLKTYTLSFFKNGYAILIWVLALLVTPIINSKTNFFDIKELITIELGVFFGIPTIITFIKEIKRKNDPN